MTFQSPPAVPAAVTQAEFARHLGVGRSYVTALKKAGRLVMDADGRVLVEESMASLARSTGAPERAAVVPELYQDNRDKRDHFVVGAMTTLRSRLESLPNVLAPQLSVVSDEKEIMALLADQIEQLLNECAADLGKLSEAQQP